LSFLSSQRASPDERRMVDFNLAGIAGPPLSTIPLGKTRGFGS
jgi:hypothetical protein